MCAPLLLFLAASVSGTVQRGTAPSPGVVVNVVGGMDFEFTDNGMQTVPASPQNAAATTAPTAIIRWRIFIQALIAFTCAASFMAFR
jgi:hypothetical protein